MLRKAKKKLIIVVDETTKVYGELLSGLITLTDDTFDADGDIKGAVETVIWNEKIYADNQAQLGSNNKIVFLGKSDTAKAVYSNISSKNDFSAYGIRYGYIANKAFVYVEDNFLSGKKELYDEFFESYSSFLSSTENKFIIEQIKEKVIIITESLPESKKEQGAFAKKAFGVFNKIDKAASKGISVLKNTKAITDQQYRCAVVAFYLNSLAEFIG